MTLATERGGPTKEKIDHSMCMVKFIAKKARLNSIAALGGGANRLTDKGEGY